MLAWASVKTTAVTGLKAKAASVTFCLEQEQPTEVFVVFVMVAH